ncbi:rho GTPase-activating protein 7-like isoform X1 [Acipenser oxyrinchus oxyrinchus]|uniref:StAR-related lipid transfer protein 13 n=1 Tax=Acipenser oxyrinchus oxyrinchus TaxID=40147 RepID=A0AAD8D2W8_ACIOX|nr:rho GTPase-activating protein 7-like isoform X1 [Acipenser oxyrinchus oxyrinchus]
MANRGKLPLRRSFSEHIKDSTNKAWDLFWKSAREKRLSEIETKEACDWLRAAGFPQYAQLFEDSQFPINIDLVKNDHEFLDRDSIDSLCRRLNTLNKCAEVKLELGQPSRRSEDSEDEEPCAISSKWAFERHSKRWSRLEGLECFSILAPDSFYLKRTDSVDTTLDSGEKQDACSLHSSSSDGSCVQKTALDNLETSRSSSRCSSSKPASLDTSFSGPPSPSEIQSCSGEEKVLEKPPKKRGKSLLRKMEKFRMHSSSLKRPPHGKAKPLISGPVPQEGFDEDKLRRFNCVDISELQGEQSRSNSSFSRLSCSSSSSSSISPSESSSAMSTPSPITRVRSHAKRAGLREEQETADLSNGNERNLQENLIFQIPQGYKPGTFPKALTNDVLAPIDTSVNWRTGSFHGYGGRRSRTSKDQELACSPLAVADHRISIYDNVPGVHVHLRKPGEIGDDDVFSELDEVMERINGIQQLVNQWTEKMSEDGDSDFANDSISPCPSSPNEMHLEIDKHLEGDDVGSETEVDNADKNANELQSAEVSFVRDSGVGSSLRHRNRQQRLHWSGEHNLHSQTSCLQIDRQSAAQLNLLQKMALLKLTALMDKHSPCSRQGWNWTVPKFIRKIKAPDYKDRTVFGVPLLLNARRTGNPLPPSILKAMHYLRNQCLDQVGLFRKSGVKSRIQHLREMNEMDPHSVSYEGQSAFDVADMVKQYFRDLPEPVFTSKLCESFLHIYQYFPKDQQLSAVQAAVLLLPDENREALQTLLCLLRDVVACVAENQMTPTNIAVCLAPSLFHLNTLKRESPITSRSSQRKHSLGMPDQRDLSENLAASQGLAHMVAESSRLFQVPEYWLFQNEDSFNDEMRQSERGQCPTQNSTQAYLHDSMQIVLTEARDKFKGWTTCVASEQVELAFKKVDDAHPLRLWKASAEIEASQGEVLNRILREQNIWDKNFQQSKVIEALDKHTEIYHYTTQSAVPQPPRDYVVQRSWQADIPTGTCVLAAASVEHAGALCEGIRGEVMACQYLIQTTGLRKTRLTHICRTDSRGRTPEWYNNVFGHQLAAELLRIRDSFKPEMKETKI